METFGNTCRICLQNKYHATIDLFAGNDESKKILNNIYLCFQIVLSFEEYLPRTLCFDCLKELNMANKFRLKCISFEQRFSAVVNQNNTNYEIDNSSCNPASPVEIEKTSLTVVSTEFEKLKSRNHMIQCIICKKILKTETSLQKHIVNMHKKRKHVGKVTGYGSERRYNCTECAYSTPHSQTLVNHMRRHNGDRPFRCECGKTFSQSASLSAHQKTHSDTTYYTCATCGKQFKHLFSLKKHLLVHEPEDFSCSVCYKVLKSRQTLRDHMHRHLNVRNYNCEDCGDTFVTSSELQSHKKKHSTNKSIECHLCDYKTNDKKYYNVHLKRHSGNKSYKCELCHFTSYTKVDVRRHMRVHTKLKPYSCPSCGQRFAHSTSVNKHMLTVHGLPHKWQDLKHKENKKNIEEVAL